MVAVLRQPDTKRTDPTKDYVSGGSLVTFGNRRTLPRPVDDVELEVSQQTYAQMLNDPEVASAVGTLKLSVIAEPVMLRNRKAKEDADFERGQEIAEFCERNIKGLQRDISETIEEMLDALSEGNKVAEQTYHYPKSGPLKGKLTLKSLKVKPRESIGFVVDPYFNVLGFVYAPPNRSTTVSITTPSEDMVLPREKFAVLTLHPKNEDPRGRIHLRAAYNGWNLKQLSWPEFLIFLLRCAVPGLVGTVAENAPDEPMRNESGEIEYDGSNQPVMLSAVQALLNALIQFRNNTAIALPHGASVTPIEVESEGQPFHRAFEIFNKEIRKAILYNELSNSEGVHQTRAASAEQADIVEMIVAYLKSAICRMICSDILRPLIKYNFGEEALEYMPAVTLGDYDRKDWSVDAEAVEKLITATTLDEDGNTVAALTYSQIQSLLMQVGIPSPTEEEVEQMRARAEERGKARDEMQKQLGRQSEEDEKRDPDEKVEQ